MPGSAENFYEPIELPSTYTHRKKSRERKKAETKKRQADLFFSRFSGAGLISRDGATARGKSAACAL